MNNSAPALVAHDIYKTFSDGTEVEVRVLSGAEIKVEQGEMIGILGSSGSGKSTLLHVLGGLDIPDKGTVSILGEDILALSERRRAALRNRYLGFVYQFHHLLPEFNALENVMMPLLIGGISKSAASDAAAKVIDEVGLVARKLHKVAEMSGGERQRIALARALVTQPACVLADEPTGNLDQSSADSVFALMRKLNQSLGTAFIIVTHDQMLANQLDRSYSLQDGVLHQQG
jgi:lipoprotein-releasing system ATP-binding protein